MRHRTLLAFAVTMAVTGVISAWFSQGDRGVPPVAAQSTPTPAVSITKSGAPSVLRGQSQTWTITVRSTGTDDLDPLTVTDVVPSGFAVISATGTGWSCTTAGNTVTCQYLVSGGLLTGATGPPIIIVATASQCGSFVNVANATATGESSGLTASGSGQHTTRVDCPTPTPSPTPTATPQLPPTATPRSGGAAPVSVPGAAGPVGPTGGLGVQPTPTATPPPPPPQGTTAPPAATATAAVTATATAAVTATPPRTPTATATATPPRPPTATATPPRPPTATPTASVRPPEGVNFQSGQYVSGAQQMTVGATTRVSLTYTLTNPSNERVDYSNTVIFELAEGVTAVSASPSRGTAAIAARAITWGGFALDPGESANIQLVVDVVPPAGSAGRPVVLVNSTTTTGRLASGGFFNAGGGQVRSDSVTGLFTGGFVQPVPAAAAPPSTGAPPAPAPAAVLPRVGVAAAGGPSVLLVLSIVLAGVLCAPLLLGVGLRRRG